MVEQERLVELPEQPLTPAKGRGAAEKKLKRIDRSQMTMVAIDVERLIEEDHPAWGIVDTVGRLDLTPFEEDIQSLEGAAGRSAWPPQLLISIWLYAYSRGISSARELERQMDYEPGLMWMTGLEVINHHTLSDFRVSHGEALTKLLSEMLVVLDSAGLVKMSLVAHDGTKIRAQGGVDAFRREATLRQKLEQARRLVEQDPQADGGVTKRQEAARERARRQRQARAESALNELTKLQADQDSEQKRTSTRVSISEPEARWMKHGDKAIVPSYNAQVSTDADSGVIVGVRLSQCADDTHELEPAIEAIEQATGRKPERMVADGGYTNRSTIEAMAEAKVDFYGSLRNPKERSEAAMKSHKIDPAYAPHFFILQPEGRTVVCPAGKVMKYLRSNVKRGDHYTTYRANGNDCRECEHRMKCCPNTSNKGRIVSFRDKEKEVMANFRQKMASEEGKAIYARRGPSAEFTFAGIKERMGLRKFRLFGQAKAGMELMWVCLTHNVMIWLRAQSASNIAEVAA